MKKRIPELPQHQSSLFFILLLLTHHWSSSSFLPSFFFLLFLPTPFSPLLPIYLCLLVQSYSVLSHTSHSYRLTANTAFIQIILLLLLLFSLIIILMGIFLILVLFLLANL